ncbi:MAG: hypothetical protein M1818_006620 [Claussenomyces sp. TS43310]|nr:MAG: hypothetical protein M1818_006620 [Claussenomyces sp. TS43310]
MLIPCRSLHSLLESSDFHYRSPLSPSQAQKGPSFEEMLAQSDVINWTLDLNSSTTDIISMKKIDKLKSGVLFINTARREWIDEWALVAALDTGKVFSLGLDVFEEEPRTHHGLRENVVLLPIMGTSTFKTWAETERLVLSNLTSAINDQKLLALVLEQLN